MTQWKKVYDSQSGYKAEIVKSILEESGFAAVVLNKQDSAYVNLGFYEVHVMEDDLMKALQIVKNDIDFK